MREVEISKRIVLINSASSIVARVLNAGIFLWLMQYLLRRVPAEEISIFYVIESLVLYIPLLAAGVTGGLARYVTEAFAKADDRRVTQIVSSMFPLCFGAGFAILILGGTLAWNINLVLTVEPAYVRDAKIMFGIMTAMVALETSVLPFRLGLWLKQKFVWIHVIQLVGLLIRLGVLFLLLFGVSTRVVWLVVASVPGGLFEIVVSIVLSCRLVTAIRMRRSEFRRDLIRPILSFGGWLFLGSTVSLIEQTVGSLSLNRLGSPVDVVSFNRGAMVETRLRQTILHPLQTTQPALIALHATVGSVARFGITRENPLGGPRYAANPNTLWISCVCPTTSPFAIHRACPLRSACMISMPRKVRHAVVNRLKPSIGRVRRLMNRWSCSMMLFRYLHWRRFERGRTSPSCRTASNATG